jgi:hypothetical protein
MSSWGTGIKQSDEFCDIYDVFFERYVDDAEPLKLADDIWAEYLSEFDDDDADPILYTVRFALAQCVWECGAKDQKLWSEIDDIIKNGKDLKFWSKLEADDKTLKSRKKNLDLFWKKINTEPQKIRRPKKVTVTRKPTLEKGDVFAYCVSDGAYRACVVFDYVWNSFLIAVTDTVFPYVPKADEVWNSKTKLVFWSSARAAIPKKDRIALDHVEISSDYNGRAGLICTEEVVGCSSCADRRYFFNSDEAKISMKRNCIETYYMKDLLDPSVLPHYFHRKQF